MFSSLNPKHVKLAFLLLLSRSPKISFRKSHANTWWYTQFNSYFYNRLLIMQMYYFISGGCGLCFCRCRKILAGICSCSNCTWRRKSGPWYSTAWPSNFSSIGPLHPEIEGHSCRYTGNMCNHQHCKSTGKKQLLRLSK